MPYGASAGAKQKGWIKNLVTGELINFQFNPDRFSYNRDATYNDIIAPGMQYPLTQFAHGNSRTFPLELLCFDNTGKGGMHLKYVYFFGDLLPPEINNNQYKKPPDFLFCYGYFIRRCVLAGLNIEIVQWGPGLSYVRQSKFTLQVRQVSPA